MTFINPQIKTLFFFGISLFIFILAINNPLSAQNDSTKTAQNNSYYFDDDRIIDAKNIFKVNLTSIINGDLPFFYERTFNKSFSLELGAGIILPYYVPELPELIGGDTKIKDPLSGYSLWICPKYYFQQRAPEFNYVGLQLRQRNYNLKDGQKIVYNYITINYGYELLFWERVLFDYSVGVGFRFRNKAKILDDDFIQVACPIMIKLGYIL